MSKDDEIKLAHESHAPVYDLGNRICRSTVAVIDTICLLYTSPSPRDRG